MVSHNPAPGLATSQVHTANDVSLEYMVSPREGCYNHLYYLRESDHKIATFAQN
jgi:hypothetical protein